MAVAVDSLSRRFEALRPHLNERQRRLWLGAEARELGPGGAGGVAAAVGVAADTVRRGRSELDDPAPAPVGSSRKAGGGRKRAEAHDPALVAALEHWSTRTAAGIRCHRCGGPASPPGRWPRRCASAVTRS